MYVLVTCHVALLRVHYYRNRPYHGLINEVGEGIDVKYPNFFISASVFENKAGDNVEEYGSSLMTFANEAGIPVYPAIAVLTAPG